jgi:hypothetical protein
MHNPQKEVKNQDPSASRTVGSQRVNGGKDSGESPPTSAGKVAESSKNRNTNRG